MTHVNFTASGATDTYGPSIALTVPQTTVGNLLKIAIAYATTGRTVSSITGGGTWDVAATRTHDFTGSAGRIAVHELICTSATTTITVTLSAGSTGPDLLAVWEVSGATDPATETGTSTEQNNSSTTTHAVGTVTPSASPCAFMAVTTVLGDTGTWTEDGDFVNRITPGSPRFHIVATRIQTDTTAQAYSATSQNSTTSSVVLVATQGVSETAQLTWLPSTAVVSGPAWTAVPVGMTPPQTA